MHNGLKAGRVVISCQLQGSTQTHLKELVILKVHQFEQGCWTQDRLLSSALSNCFHDFFGLVHEAQACRKTNTECFWMPDYTSFPQAKVDEGRSKSFTILMCISCWGIVHQEPQEPLLQLEHISAFLWNFLVTCASKYKVHLDISLLYILCTAAYGYY